MLKNRNLGKKKKVIKISLILNLLILIIISISAVVLLNGKERTVVSKMNINKPKKYSFDATVDCLTSKYYTDSSTWLKMKVPKMRLLWI